LEKPIILILSNYFFPGYKAGGPIRSLCNLVEHLGGEFHFKIITTDRDFGDDRTYEGIKPNEWIRIGNSDVYYLSPENLSISKLRKVINSTKHDILYINSFFSPLFSIKPLLLRKFNLIPRVPVILAPRGEFSDGALGLKSFKKHIFILFSKIIFLHKGVIWQASSEYEKNDIGKFFNRNSVVIAPDLPPFSRVDNLRKNLKKAGKLKILFLSRITRMKNLDMALRFLTDLKGRIEFNIFGPIDDETYWEECRSIIENMPKNVNVKYKGVLKNEMVYDCMSQHDILLLPTLGENYGHVILESLIAGTPVIISNRTPWRNLEEMGVGWDIPLEDISKFKEVLQRCVDMDKEAYEKLSNRAREFGIKISRNKEVIDANRNLFRLNLN
jgi:glycosyltransferase involved in cell wall biosynthesis